MARPIEHADDLWIEDLDEEIVILAGDTDRIHVLNETAAELWRLVDGVRDRRALVEAFAGLYPDVPRDQVEADGRALLARWRDLGLIRGEGIDP